MSKRKKRQMQKRPKKAPSFKNLHKNMEIVEVSDGEKMSDVILKFVEPFRESASTLGAFKSLIIMAIVAWNTHITKDNSLIETLKETFEGGWEEEVDQLLIALMVRKERLFADNQRLILDYQVTETDDEFNLQVLSTPDKTDVNIKP